MFGGSFAPAGWAFCNGAILPIAENDALFTLIGTTYGGDGEQTFALPNLSSRYPLHQGTNPTGATFTIGETGGVETVTLTVNQLPVHTHQAGANSNPGNSGTPANSVWSSPPSTALYSAAVPDVSMSVNAVALTGGSQPHENMMPFLCVTFIISLFGIFPQQN
jgi:microcystin-dependent protein